jgi:hypothetical protein
MSFLRDFAVIREAYRVISQGASEEVLGTHEAVETYMGARRVAGLLRRGARLEDLSEEQQRAYDTALRKEWWRIFAP